MCFTAAVCGESVLLAAVEGPEPALPSAAHVPTVASSVMRQMLSGRCVMLVLRRMMSRRPAGGAVSGWQSPNAYSPTKRRFVVTAP